MRTDMSFLQTDLEYSVMIGLIEFPEIRQLVLPMLTPEHFTIRAYKSVLETLRNKLDSVVRDDGTIDPVGLVHAAAHNDIDTPELADALLKAREQVQFKFAPDDIGKKSAFLFHASALHENMLRREYDAYCQEMQKQDRGLSPIDLAKTFAEKLTKFTNPFEALKVDTVDNDVRFAVNAACNPADTRILTGLEEWDNTVDGLHRGATYVVLGHGGVSKTGLALNLAWRISKQGKSVAYLSYEETKTALWWRIFAMQTGIPITAFRNGLSEKQQIEFVDKEKAIIGAPLHIIDDVHTMQDGVQRAAAVHASHELGLVVVDVVSNIAPNQRESEVEKAKRVGLECMRMAKDLKVPVLILAHVNSEALKGKAGMTSAYGGQGLNMTGNTVVELRRDFDAIVPNGMVRINAHVVKNRYGIANAVMEFNFEGERMRYHGNKR